MILQLVVRTTKIRRDWGADVTKI